ncbi:hypothetical protein D9756_002003 [Leucocoprinus leucothites]|uniref:Uncharacterized protein n=1 Tax=Leucocoprinus leucothites TaxID=201217 RepID=A0A8H5GCS9_9AGAR|nr:hypothetical protein D9756_002003 [Leucoagaricus leucothites]
MSPIPHSSGERALSAKWRSTHEQHAATLHVSKPYLAPLVPIVIDDAYLKLFEFTITVRSFVPRNTGYSGKVPTSAEELNPGLHRSSSAGLPQALSFQHFPYLLSTPPPSLNAMEHLQSFLVSKPWKYIRCPAAAGSFPY